MKLFFTPNSECVGTIRGGTLCSKTAQKGGIKSSYSNILALAEAAIVILVDVFLVSSGVEVN